MIQLFESSGLRPGRDGVYTLPLKGIQRIKLDVGLSLTAVHAVTWLREDPHLLVIGFEPVEECVASIREILAEEGMRDIADRFILLQCALSDNDGKAEFFVTEGFGTSSLEEPIEFGEVRTEAVSTFKLETILNLLDFESISRIDYLKTDCQGHDFKVLNGAGSWLERIAVITCESWAPGYKLRKSDSELEISRHLRAWGFVSLNRKSWKVALSSYFHNARYLSFIKPAAERLSLLVKEGTRELQRQSAQATGGGSSVSSDPTFLNKRFEEDFRGGSITYYQHY